MKFTRYIIKLFLLPALLFIACVDTDLEEVVEYKNHYKTLSDADNAILGLYGKFMELAEPVVILNELRADLMDVTYNSSKDIQEINLAQPSVGNKYTDITPFYSVIQNCNDILHNFKIMKDENRMTEDEYRERYSDVIGLRSWVYFQLGIQFGEVIYLTEPMITVEDVLKNQGQKTIAFDALLDELISCMESSSVSLDDYANSPLIEYYLDGYELSFLFINKYLLLGDLYLWRGDYLKAATLYRKVLSKDEDQEATLNHRYYKLNGAVWYSNSEPYFQIVYWRYKWDDINSYRNKWKTMFELPVENSEARQEHIWTVSYDASFAPTYPFVGLFANTGRGNYQVKPSQYAIENWENEVQKNNFVFDGRGRNSSFEEVNGEYVIQKYLYNYDNTKPFEQAGKWFLYRAGLLHLRYAEAANRAGYPLLAYAIVNHGIKSVYDWDDVEHDGQRRQSGWGPDNYYPEPFYFDARESQTPYHRGPWRLNDGVRGRANLKAKNFPEDAITLQDSIQFMERVIIEEAALEVGFEGHRWGDLTRIARRMNKEGRSGNQYLIDNLKGKYERSGIAMPDYSNEANWYLPFATN